MEESSFSQMPVLRPKNWLVESILVTILCCLPFGIAGIVFAAQVNGRYDAGDYTGAEIASHNAAKWTKIGFFVGLALGVLYVFTLVTVVGTGVVFLNSH